MKTDKAFGKRRRMLGGERVRRSFRTEVSPLATLVRVLPLARVKRATRAYPVHKRYRHLSGGNRQAIGRFFPPDRSLVAVPRVSPSIPREEFLRDKFKSHARRQASGRYPMRSQRFGRGSGHRPI